MTVSGNKLKMDLFPKAGIRIARIITWFLIPVQTLTNTFFSGMVSIT
jgi:hypothetical protein